MITTLPDKEPLSLYTTLIKNLLIKNLFISMFLLLLMPGKDAHTATVTIEAVNQSAYDAWLPTEGGTLQFRVTVSNRSRDYAGGRVHLSFISKLSSNWPGTCMNADTGNFGPRQDLRFYATDQKTHSVTDANWGAWHNTQTTATWKWERYKKTPTTFDFIVTVRCEDYGAYGTLQAKLTEDFPFWRDPAPEYATIKVPKDDNNNYIADAWLNDGTVTGYRGTDTGYVPGADSEQGPTGNTHPGDGLTVFEEYRGFLIKGTHKRTDPHRRDLFIYNEFDPSRGNTIKSVLPADAVGLGDATDLQTPPHNFRLHQIHVSEMSGGAAYKASGAASDLLAADRVINFYPCSLQGNRPTFWVVAQKAILVLNDKTPYNAQAQPKQNLGEAYVRPAASPTAKPNYVPPHGGVPHLSDRAVIYTEVIRGYAAEEAAHPLINQNPRHKHAELTEKALRNIIAHEIAHFIGLDDHQLFQQLSPGFGANPIPTLVWLHSSGPGPGIMFYQPHLRHYSDEFFEGKKRYCHLGHPLRSHYGRPQGSYQCNNLLDYIVRVPLADRQKYQLGTKPSFSAPLPLQDPSPAPYENENEDLSKTCPYCEETYNPDTDAHLHRADTCTRCGVPFAGCTNTGTTCGQFNQHTGAKDYYVRGECGHTYRKSDAPNHAPLSPCNRCPYCDRTYDADTISRHRVETCTRCGVTFGRCTNTGTTCGQFNQHTGAKDYYVRGECGHTYRKSATPNHARVASCTATARRNGQTVRCTRTHFYMCRHNPTSPSGHTFPNTGEPTLTPPTTTPPPTQTPPTQTPTTQTPTTTPPTTTPPTMHPCGEHTQSTPGAHTYGRCTTRNALGQLCLGDRYACLSHTHTYPAMHPCGKHPQSASGNHAYIRCTTQNSNGQRCTGHRYACQSHSHSFPAAPRRVVCPAE